MSPLLHGSDGKLELQNRVEKRQKVRERERENNERAKKRRRVTVDGRRKRGREREGERMVRERDLCGIYMHTLPDVFFIEFG